MCPERYVTKKQNHFFVGYGRKCVDQMFGMLRPVNRFSCLRDKEMKRTVPFAGCVKGLFICWLLKIQQHASVS